MITKFDENSSGSKCKPDSLIQGASEGTEERRRETSGSGRSQRMRSRKDFKQEKDEGSGKIFDMMERFYSRGRHLGIEGKPEKCKRVDRGVRKRRNRSKTIRENGEEERGR